MQALHIQAARRLGRRLEQQIATLYALRVGTLWAFAAGAGVGGWRLWRGELPGSAATLAALGVLLAGLCVAAFLARRRRPPPGRLVALLDCLTSAGGLPSAAAQGVAMNAWPVPAPDTLPHVRCDWAPDGRRLAAGLLFLAGCLFMPVPAEAVIGRQRLHVNRATDEIRNRLERLADEDLASAQELAKWKEELDRIAKDASGQDPVKSWEALDYVKDAVDGKTSEAVRNAQDWNQAMQQAADALQVMQELAENKGMTPGEQAKALAALAENLRSAQAQTGTPMPPEMAEAIKNLLAGQEAANLTPEQMQKLMQALAKAQSGLKQNLDNVTKMRVLSPEELQRLLDNLEAGGSCKGNPKEMAVALLNLAACQSGNGQSGVSAESLMAACENGMPGSGAPTRGRGDAALTWTGNTAADGAKFKPQALPAGSVLDLEHTRVEGVSLGAAQEKTGGVTTGTGQLAGVGGGATQARTQTVLPRHRQAVEAYFERGAKGGQ